MGVPKLIGRYEIVEELGRGAMGSVFKAKDPAVGRIVALKTIHTTALEGAQSEEYRTRFYREARASGVLAHPGIVPVFDVGEDQGAPFLVMEFVEGRTLGEAIKKGERFTLDRVCEIGQQIAEALGYAHRQGVIHRDIKPANILMTSKEVYGSERPRITDFGIAKLASSDITTTGQLLGTPSFMPPEQFTGSPIDGRADLFSLGVILYSLATGEQPFPGETMTAVSYKVVYTEPVPPAKLNPAIPGADRSGDPEVPGQEPRGSIPDRRRTCAGPGGCAHEPGNERDAVCAAHAFRDGVRCHARSERDLRVATASAGGCGGQIRSEAGHKTGGSKAGDAKEVRERICHRAAFGCWAWRGDCRWLVLVRASQAAHSIASVSSGHDSRSAAAAKSSANRASTRSAGNAPSSSRT